MPLSAAPSRFLSTLSLRRATSIDKLGKNDSCNFYPRSPCGERPHHRGRRPRVGRISIHALLAESDGRAFLARPFLLQFLSTLSLRRATVTVLGIQHRVGISIHALLAESDRSSCAESSTITAFLSTLSLRRATLAQANDLDVSAISIHALLAESDFVMQLTRNVERSISIHALLAESDRPRRAWWQTARAISIHALLAESDRLPSLSRFPTSQFLSTLSLRRATSRLFAFAVGITSFLSTLSLRRATQTTAAARMPTRISIHALLAESDLVVTIKRLYLEHFYPRSPCGERRGFGASHPKNSQISIHALLAESDLFSFSAGRGSDTISIHALLAESDSMRASTMG